MSDARPHENDEGPSAGTDTDDAAETTNADETLGDIAADSDKREAGDRGSAG
jgi:hypothetical protein